MLFRSALLCLVSLAAPAPGSAEGPRAGAVQVLRDRSRDGYGLRAADTTLERAGAALARALGCTVAVAPELKPCRLSLDLSPRPPERLFLSLARRAGARLTVVCVLSLPEPGKRHHPGSRLLARQPVTLMEPEPLPLPELARRLPGRVEVRGEVTGRARVIAQGHPLGQVLDSIADQAGVTWETVVRLEPRRPVDAAAAAEERVRFHFADLARLSPQERQEELSADLEALDRLPPSERAAAVRQLARTVAGLADLYQATPGEHRGPVAPLILAILRDYDTLLAGLPAGRREALAPLAEALAAVRERLASIR